MKLTPRAATPGRERLMNVVTIGGMTAAFLAAVHLPGRRADELLRTEIKAAAAQIARGPQTLDQLREATRTGALRETYLRQTAGVLPPEQGDAVLGRISQLAARKRLTLLRLEPEPPLTHASYVERPYRLDFQGTHPAVVGFLQELEQQDRVFALSSLTAQNMAGSAGGGSLAGSLRFSVYARSADGAAFAEDRESFAARHPIVITR